MGFSSDIAERALTSCGRKCAICHKFCGIKMELHHIIPVADGGDNSFDNCIPLCLDCHAEVKAYNPKHPKGRQYTESELKKHRDLWYNRFTLKENTSKQDLPVLPIQKKVKKVLAPKTKSEKKSPIDEIDEKFFANEYPDLVANCQRIKKTIGSYEWKIIKAVLAITDYGFAVKGACTTMSALLFELGVSMDYIDIELSNLVRMGYILLEDDEIILQGKTRLILDLADKVSETLNPEIYPEEMFSEIMENLIY
jgi:glutaredoxin